MRILKRNHKSKPKNNSVPILNYEINQVFDRNYSLNEFVDSIQNGNLFVLDTYDNVRKDENFIKTKYIGIDVDDEDANFLETSKLLNKNGISSFYVRYKSFSYTTKHQKHRYILKFDEYLDRVETYRVYEYISTFLNVDSSTINNLCRLWHGTNHKMSPDDAPGDELSKDYILNEVIPISITGERNLNYNREFDFMILNIQEDELLKRISADILEWDYENIRRTTYAACLIIQQQVGDSTYIEYFLDNLEHQYRKKWETYVKHDVDSGKFYYASALRFLEEYAFVTPNKVENIFDIIQGVVPKHLKDGEFITPNDMKSLESGYNLLIAPAGSGKTTAIIRLAQEDRTQRRVLIVPTIAIVEQLQHKYGLEEGVEFLHSGEGGTTSASSSYSIYLTICTYDSYTTNVFPEHVLYVDEAHELISFYDIGKKEKIVHQIVTQPPKNCIYVTATPFNLADIFDKKVLFTKNTNKDTRVLFTTNVKTTTFNIIAANYGRKTLVYMNSKSKMRNFKKYIQDKLPELRVATISSHERSDAYVQLRQLVESADFSYDVVITTKFLNIGFDINNVFDDVIYADETIRANDMLQFYNRERQHAKMHIITKNHDDANGYSVNTRFSKVRVRLNSRLSNQDKYYLDKTVVDGRAHPHIITNKVFYQRVTLSVRHIKQLFKKFYPNFDTDVITRVEAKLYVDTRTNTKCEFFNYFFEYEGDSLRIEKDFMRYIDGNPINFKKEDDEPAYGTSTIRKIYRLFYILRNDFFNNEDRSWIEENGYLEVSNDETYFSFNRDPIDYFYLSDMSNINKFENEKLKDIIKSINEHRELGEDEVEDYSLQLNSRMFYMDNSPWNLSNFKKRMERFGIIFEVTTDELMDPDDETVVVKKKVFVNKTVMIGKD